MKSLKSNVSLLLRTEQLPTSRQKERLEILSGIVILAILSATLWPFNFLPANKVSWLPGANGISFAGRGVVISNAVLGIGDSDGAGSLEILLRPASLEASNTILSFYTPDNPNQFLVRQWTDGLLVTHDVFNAQMKAKRTKFDVDHAFQEGKLLLLTLNFKPAGTAVYLDGRPAKVLPRFIVSKNELSGHLVLGTAPEDFQPWSGEVHGLAIYAKSLTDAQVAQHYENWLTEFGANSPDLDGAMAYYNFTEGSGRDVHNRVQAGPDLEIPKKFVVPDKAFLKSPKREFAANWDYVNDVLRNIAGFVPLGFILCAYLNCTRKRPEAMLLAILGGGILSFTIELVQFYVPQRNSGITDIITNTVGTALGAVLVRPGTAHTILEKTKLIPAIGISDSRSQ
jgi:VanZ family protein